MKSPRVLQFNVILGLAWWLAGAVSADQPKSYHGYSVVRANPRTVTNLQSLHSLERDKVNTRRLTNLNHLHSTLVHTHY